MPRNACFIDGRSVALAEATHAAAGLIAASRLPVFLIGASDVAGARAAIRLAACVGGAVDHIASEGALRELDVMRSFGKFIVTPSEARNRADTVLLIGSSLTKAWPDMADVLGLAAGPRLALQPGRREILWIGADREEGLARLAGQTIVTADETLPAVIAALRARNAGRRVGLAASELASLDAIVEKLQRAQFGLVVYNPSILDALAIEMVAGLVADLNRTTRFSTISGGGAGNAETLMQTAGWMTGFPVRIGLGRGYPEHDPWRFGARRLVESREADLVVWIASNTAELPVWAAETTLAALTAATSNIPAAKVQITVGEHGRDHDAVEFVRETQSLAWRRASKHSDVPSAAALLDDILASLTREAA
ncbi:MAG: formylmethanofuran dehydrogenase [Methylobacteriaceae bacterium]|nr:formylmethanofuran dehydrogenase [Methylobacteriaceae bacterium]